MKNISCDQKYITIILGNIGLCDHEFKLDEKYTQLPKISEPGK